MAMKENSKKVLNYLKEINGENVTAADVAVALGLEKRSSLLSQYSLISLQTSSGLSVGWLRETKSFIMGFVSI